MPRPGARSMVLNISHRCNLRCKYCFVDLENEMMSKEVVKKAAKVIPWRDPRKGPEFISFFGGEPLTNFKLIEYVAQLFPRATLHVTTNGTLIDPAMIRLFQTRKFTFIVSLDGDKETHDANRVYADGRGSWEDVVKGLVKLRDAKLTGRVTLRGTYTIDNPNLSSRVLALNEVADEGLAHACAVEPADDRTDEYTAEHWKEFADQYQQAVDWCVERLFRGKRARWRIMEKFYARVKTHQLHAATCGGAIGVFTINPGGEIFACHREGDTQVGHVDTGLEQERLDQWACNRHVNAKLDCRFCGAALICGGPCRYSSLRNCGSQNEPFLVDCRVRGVTALNAYRLAANKHWDSVLTPWLRDAKRR